MAIRAEVGHQERLEIIPVVTLQRPRASAPRAGSLPLDESELFRQRGGVAGGSGPDPSRTGQVLTDLEVSLEAGELVLNVLTWPTGSLHRTGPAEVGGSPHERRHDGEGPLPRIPASCARTVSKLAMDRVFAVS